jgi:transcriptional regulator with XRE-family HTH domain
MTSETAGHYRTPRAFDRELGRRLKAQRISRGWTLEGLQERSEGRFKVSAVRAYELGTRCPPLKTFVELAELLDGSVLRLLPLPDVERQRSVVEDDLLAAFMTFASLPAPVAQVPAPRDGEAGLTSVEADELREVD